MGRSRLASATLKNNKNTLGDSFTMTKGDHNVKRKHKNQIDNDEYPFPLDFISKLSHLPAELLTQVYFHTNYNALKGLLQSYKQFNKYLHSHAYEPDFDNANCIKYNWPLWRYKCIISDVDIQYEEQMLKTYIDTRGEPDEN